MCQTASDEAGFPWTPVMPLRVHFTNGAELRS